jgi:hypothetical protein
MPDSVANVLVIDAPVLESPVSVSVQNWPSWSKVEGRSAVAVAFAASRALAAVVAEVDAAVAEFPAFVAWVLAVVADPDAAVALPAAAVALVAAAVALVLAFAAWPDAVVAELEALVALVLAAPADVAAFVADVDAALALVAAPDAEVDAALALVAAAEALPAAAASLVASRSRSYSSWTTEPEEVAPALAHTRTRARTYAAVGCAATIAVDVVSFEKDSHPSATTNAASSVLKPTVPSDVHEES